MSAEFDEESLKTLASKKTSVFTEDPTGTFPYDAYMNKINTNAQAMGEERNDLKWASSSPEMNLTVADEVINSQFGYNQVQRSITGHSFEIDDTPGNERVLIMHKDGAGIELRPDGGVSISSLKTRVDVIGGTYEMIVSGDANLTYNGNVNMKVKGEFNVECLDFNVTAKGNKTETIRGSETRKISKGTNQTITGNSTSFITENKTDIILGNYHHSIKGNWENNIEGNVSIFSNADMNLTGKTLLNGSSSNITLSANDMTVQGGAGTIGGTGMLFSGKGARFEEGVTSPTFTGDLDGLAKQAMTADASHSQIYSDGTGTGYSPSTGTANGWAITDNDTPLIVKPTADNVNEYLTKSQGGYRNVAVDDGNFIKKYIDRSDDNDGLSVDKMDAGMARSKFRDPNNKENDKVVGTLLKEDTIARTYNDPLPPKIGRIIDGKTNTVIASESHNIRSKSQTAIFVPKNKPQQYVPTYQYNPNFMDDITSHTKLSPHTSMAAFLGTDDPTNLEYFRNLTKKKEIARYYAAHTYTILEPINMNQKAFNGISLQVSEGLYRPGPTEKITKNSINDYKSYGRAVVYKAIDAKGTENNNAIFDIAAYLKDTAFYEQLILSYDTLETDKANNPILAGRLIVVMPELTLGYKGNFAKKVSTEFNGNKLSNGELVEVLLDKPVVPEVKVYNAKATSNQLIDWGPSDSRVNPTLIAILERIAQQMGKPFIVPGPRSAFRDPKKPKAVKVGAGTSSQHVLGNAVDISTEGWTNVDRAKAISIAIDEGIKGIGVYTRDGAKKYGKRQSNLLHFDIRPGKVAWGDNYSRTSLYLYPWAKEVLDRNGYRTA